MKLISIHSKSIYSYCAYSHYSYSYYKHSILMTTQSGRRLNHLANEKSLYLQQHASNPVDWRPWGPTALELAKARQMPIFLSIGYASCHWCHVMERESFQQPHIAALLNASFVCIKVDREERPDIDGPFLQFVSALTGSAGWPLSVFLTPELKPFHGGTYMPPDIFAFLLSAIAKK